MLETCRGGPGSISLSVEKTKNLIFLKDPPLHFIGEALEILSNHTFCLFSLGIFIYQMNAAYF